MIYKQHDDVHSRMKARFARFALDLPNLVRYPKKETYFSVFALFLALLSLVRV